ncbi:MAG: potassium-transporting ATPase subunit C [Jatrophihabitans sp.]
MIVKNYARQIVAALRVLIALTVVLGIGYPLVITAAAQVPGLQSRADGSLVHSDGKVIGSALLGQSFTDKSGRPLRQYFQSRPSASNYDPTTSGASNLGPESVQDAPGAPSLLTTVCTRSRQIGRLEGVDGARPYCTSDGVGAVLRVFHAEPGYRGPVTSVVSANQPCPATPFIDTYRGVTVTCAGKGVDLGTGRLVLVRGDAPAKSAVPPDAVTASGSGLDPHISPAYAQIQVRRVAEVRGTSIAQVEKLVKDATSGRLLGFFGEPTVNVVELNLALDARYPAR